MSRPLYNRSSSRISPRHHYAYWDTGALANPEFLTITPGWNVWDVWQVKNLPFSIAMMGLDRDRQLRIWVEDKVRLGAPGSVIADPIDLKGGQVQILNGKPVGLSTGQRKEQVSGPLLVVDGPADLRTVRFFNRGDSAVMAWPHDESYLLDQTYVPSPSNPATSGPAPDTIAGGIGKGASGPVKEFFEEMFPVLATAGVFGAVYLLRKELFSSVKRKLRKR